MRVLIACPDYVPCRPDYDGPRSLGGVSHNVDAMARGLLALGVEPVVVCAACGPDEEVRVGAVRALYRRAPADLPRVVSDIAPDLVVGMQGSGWSLGAVRAARDAGVPSVVYAQHESVWLEHVAFGEMPDGWLWVQRWLRERVRELTSEDPLPLGTEEVLHPPVGWVDEARVRPRTSVPVREKCVTLVNVSALKGGALFAEVARRMPERKFLGVLSWGDQVQVPLPNVSYEPATWWVRDVYARTDVLLMPSHTEMFGSTAVQAQRVGIPVIASNLPPLEDALGRGAIFLDPHDVGAWVDALHALEHRPIRSHLVEAGHQNASRFDSLGEIRRCVAMFERLMVSRR